MKTSDFIAKYAEAIRNGERCHRRKCSSVLVDDSTIYSYGSHYPLLYPIGLNNRLLVVNAAGYSVSTSRHIGYASACADITVYSSGILQNTESVRAHLVEKLHTLSSEMNMLKRKNTQKAEHLRGKINRVSEDINKLDNA